MAQPPPTIKNTIVSDDEQMAGLPAQVTLQVLQPLALNVLSP
jgi:hypothetical protein